MLLVVYNGVIGAFNTFKCLNPGLTYDDVRVASSDEIDRYIMLNK